VRETLHVIRPAVSSAAFERAVLLLHTVPPPGSAVAAGPAVLPLLIAWLACGWTHRVRGLLRAAAVEWEGAANPDPPTAVFPAVVARYTAWTGDLATTAAVWPAVRAAVAAVTTDPAGGDVVSAAALAGIERTAADLGDAHLAARLHSRARAARAALPPPTSDSVRRLATALGLTDPPLRASHSPQGDDVGAAAELVMHIAHMVLGLEPDATRHRLWLRPRPPHGSDGLAAGTIRIGDDSVSMDLDREPGVLRLRIEQDSGAIPLTALVELLVPGRPLLARVDGSSASLEPRPVEGGALLPVQLVLDHARYIEVEYATETGPNAEGPPT
jgi:hypothetical protein